MTRRTRSAFWIIALDGTLARSVKGELEMASLIGIPKIAAGGAVICVIPAIAFVSGNRRSFQLLDRFCFPFCRCTPP
jgi:hypothetical protein